MNRLIFMISFALTVVSLPLCAQDAPPPAPTIYGATAEKQFTGHYYRLYTGRTDLENARKAAIRDGGQLVEINSDDENQFLTDWLSAYVGKFLIGAVTDAEGNWISPSGQELSYANWNNPDAASAKSKIPRTAVIEFQQTGGKWDIVPPSAKVSGFVAEFKTKPKTMPKPADAFGLDELPEMEVEQLEVMEKSEPTLSDLPVGGISANLLFSRYVYAGGAFRERYLDKEIMVAGITRVADIREITEKDVLWQKYKGKYFMRLMGDNIICFLSSKPLIEGNSSRIIVKVQGKITRGPLFQQIVLDEARFMNYRRSQPQRRLPTGKPDEETVQTGGMLTKFDDLLNKGTFELQVDQNGTTISCSLGADPDGYGIELYWLMHSSSIEQLLVGIIGVKSIPDEPESPMINCRIAGWGIPSSMMNGAPPPMKGKDTPPPRQQ